MVLRSGQGYEKLWGCSLFPDCRGSRQCGPAGEALMTDDEEERHLLDWI